MTTLPASISVLEWAAQRADLDESTLTRKFPRWPEWIRGEAEPSARQLEDFSKKTHVPFGYFFLPEPPEEQIPIPDYRTISGNKVVRPSPALLETVYAMQRRQAWMREDQMQAGIEPFEFVGSASVKEDAEAVGRELRRMLGLNDGWAAQVRTWTAAVGEFRHAIEDLGVMAVVNGVVGNNTHWKLEVEEFRGFALSDPYAPLIFVNGSDAKSAQMFTLAHELAHIWLGESALTDASAAPMKLGETETWCNQVAAECLVPRNEVKVLWRDLRHDEDPTSTLARRFKVSPVVGARRLLDLGYWTRDQFFDFYDAYTREEKKRASQRAGGGDFYNNQNTRVGELFATRVLHAAMEGRMGYKEAYDLTGLQGGIFEKYARKLGVDL
ncbi:MAG: ImmA/IrrE family metallo-endopeptidase [Kiritimatiellia bacterium]